MRANYLEPPPTWNFLFGYLFFLLVAIVPSILLLCGTWSFSLDWEYNFYTGIVVFVILIFYDWRKIYRIFSQYYFSKRVYYQDVSKLNLTPSTSIRTAIKLASGLGFRPLKNFQAPIKGKIEDRLIYFLGSNDNHIALIIFCNSQGVGGKFITLFENKNQIITEFFDVNVLQNEVLPDAMNIKIETAFSEHTHLLAEYKEEHDLALEIQNPQFLLLIMRYFPNDFLSQPMPALTSLALKAAENVGLISLSYLISAWLRLRIGDQSYTSSEYTAILLSILYLSIGLGIMFYLRKHINQAKKKAA